MESFFLGKKIQILIIEVKINYVYH